MKTCALILVLFFGLFPASPAQEADTAPLLRIPAVAAKDHIGSTVVVTGRIAEVHVSEKVVRLNFDQRFPRQPFVAVIFAGQTNRFDDLPRLEGKQAEVTGKVVEYRGRPEIVLTSTNQLKVVQRATNRPPPTVEEKR